MKNKITIKIITAGLFIIAAVFSFSTKGTGFRIAGILYILAAICFIFSAINKSNKN